MAASRTPEPYPALTALIHEPERSHVKWMRQTGGAPVDASTLEAAVLRVERARSKTMREAVNALLGIVARDPQVIFGGYDGSQPGVMSATWSKLASAELRETGVHWSLIKVPLAAGILRTDTPVAWKRDAKGTAAASTSPRELPTLWEWMHLHRPADPHIFAAIGEDAGVPYPETATVVEKRAWPASNLLWELKQALQSDRVKHRGFHLSRTIPGAQSPFADMLDYTSLRDGFFEGRRRGLTPPEPYTAILDVLLDAGADPRTDVWTPALGRVPLLEALLRGPLKPPAPCVAMHLIERRPDLISDIPDFDAKAAAAAATWKTRMSDPFIAQAAWKLESVRMLRHAAGGVTATARPRRSVIL